MTSTAEFTNFGTRESGTYKQTKDLGNGLSVTLTIVGEDETIAQGNAALNLLADVVKEQVAMTLTGKRYDFTEPVKRTLSVDHGDDTYTVAITFKPTGKLRLKGVNRASVTHTLEHAMVAVQMVIVTTTCIDKLTNALFGSADSMIGIVSSLFGTSGAYVPDDLFGAPGRGGSFFSSGFPYPPYR